MIDILGKKYITDKEASTRYGYSQRWFIKARKIGNGPKHVQLQERGRVLYPLLETDEWFKSKIQMTE